MVYGGIASNFIHATETEKFLTGKVLNNDTLQGALKILQQEVKPQTGPLLASPKYRIHLTQALLYKV